MSTVTTLETSPDWIIQIMFFLYSNPHLLRNVRLLHVPADWHPDWKNGRKAYWTKNDCSMTFADISLLERDYINCLGRNNNATILCLDGGIRCFSMVFLAERNLLEQYEIIVLDNTEARFHSMYWEPFLKDKFIRFDFVTGHLRQLKNPKLNHVTTVFVRKDRVAKCRQVPLENKTQWEMQELCLHQSFEYNEESRVIVNNFADHEKKKLQGHGLL